MLGRTKEKVSQGCCGSKGSDLVIAKQDGNARGSEANAFYQKMISSRPHDGPDFTTGGGVEAEGLRELKN